jgi:hypothetical protein
VVEADVTDNVQQYSVYYKDGVGGSFTSLGNPGTIGAGRNLNALRFYVNNSFAGDGEFFDVNRIYLTDENPITDPVEPVTLSLIVNKTTRDVFLKNESDEAISFDSYRIESESSSLSFAGWESLSDRMPALDPFEGGDDPGEKWLKSVGSNDGVLAESFLLSFSTLDHDESLYLGKAFKMGGVEDLLFQYHELDGESVVTVAPTYITSAGVPGDYNENGIVDAADYTVWRDRLNQATTLPNTDVADVDNMVTLAEYNFWVSRFGMTSGAGSLSSNAAVPEPASGQIGAAVLLLAAALVRRRLGVD